MVDKLRDFAQTIIKEYPLIAGILLIVSYFMVVKNVESSTEKQNTNDNSSIS